MANLFTVLALLAVLSGGLCEEKELLLRVGRSLNSRPYRSVLTVNNGERWGSWRWIEMCPEEYYAVGFSIRVERAQGRGDDTALNGIRLYCAKDESRKNLFSVESHPGFFGEWSSPQYCPSGFLTAFQLRVESYLGHRRDDTSANNIKFHCSGNIQLEGAGMNWGEYGHWSETCTDGGICGIQVKMEAYVKDKDDTTLNDVRFFCCDRSSQ